MAFYMHSLAYAAVDNLLQKNNAGNRERGTGNGKRGTGNGEKHCGVRNDNGNGERPSPRRPPATAGKLRPRRKDWARNGDGGAETRQRRAGRGTGNLGTHLPSLPHHFL
jgi:hypothetical protein